MHPLLDLVTRPSELPRVSLLTRPATLALTLGDRLWIADDSDIADAYAGNKVRKLEFLLGDALRRGAKRVVTVGAIGSHHALATTVYARQCGLLSHVLQFPQPLNPHVETNLAALLEQGATTTLVDHPSHLPRHILLAQLRSLLGDDCYIPGGGSSACGALGYANAGLWLVEALRARGADMPERLYVTAGTAGTLAGLALGLGLAGVTSTTVVGVRVTDRIVCNQTLVRQLLRGQITLLQRAGGPRMPALPRIELTGRFFGKGYGIPLPAAEQALRRGASEGIKLDSTYTARTYAALLEDLDRHPGATFLYWHTLNARPLGPLLPRTPRAWPKPHRDRIPGLPPLMPWSS